MTVDDELGRLLSEREHALRLSPERALGDLADAGQFLEDRGMLTRSSDSSLPALYDACHEEPYRRGGTGFASWPRSQWTYFALLQDPPRAVALKVHRGKQLLVSHRVLGLLDPICRAEIERMRRSDRSWARLLDHLDAAGPAELGSLRDELGLRPPELRELRHPLERCGAIVARSVVLESDGGHEHSSLLFRYDQLVEEPLGAERDPCAALLDLVVAGVRAAVVARRAELSRWFTWRWYAPGDMCELLCRDGRLRPIGDDFVTSGDL